MTLTLNTRRPAHLWAAAGLAAVLAAGCGESRAKLGKVTGRVTFRNAPVPTGGVTFLPVEVGPPATGTIGRDGTFTLTTYDPGDGAMVGKHLVMINALEEPGAGQALEPHMKDAMPRRIIPFRYTNTSTSGLTAEVNDGANTFTFELMDDKK